MVPWLNNVAPTGRECLFPATGVAFCDALLLLINLIWMLGMTVIWPAQDEREQEFLKDRTLILVALNRLHSALCDVGSQGQSLETLWNSSVDTKHRLFYRMLMDIDNIFGCFIRVILPFERPQIFYAVHNQRNFPAATTKHKILWPHYHEPRMLSLSSDPPNLVQALNTYSMAFRLDWQSYFNLQANQLVLPPSAFVATTPAALPPQPRAGRDDKEPQPRKAKAAASDPQGKRTPTQAATVPLLQFAASVPASNHTFEFVKTSLQDLRDQGHRPPKVVGSK
jgi:hypothetical protein